ncbi:MAG: helix-turn-helix domain-containing protein [Acidimicrobiales bacterium]
MPSLGSGTGAPKLLTVPQAAAALGVGQSTVHNLICTGELGSRKPGGSRRIPVEDHLHRSWPTCAASTSWSPPGGPCGGRHPRGCVPPSKQPSPTTTQCRSRPAASRGYRMTSTTAIARPPGWPAIIRGHSPWEIANAPTRRYARFLRR